MFVGSSQLEKIKKMGILPFQAVAEGFPGARIENIWLRLDPYLRYSGFGSCFGKKLSRRTCTYWRHGWLANNLAGFRIVVIHLGANNSLDTAEKKMFRYRQLVHFVRLQNPDCHIVLSTVTPRSLAKKKRWFSLKDRYEVDSVNRDINYCNNALARLAEFDSSITVVNHPGIWHRRDACIVRKNIL